MAGGGGKGATIGICPAGAAQSRGRPDTGEITWSTSHGVPSTDGCKLILSEPGADDASEFAYDAHHGDRAVLIQTDAQGRPARFVDDYTFGGALSDESFGRWPNGTGNFYPMGRRTLLDETSSVYPRPGLGAPNAQPRVGPLLLKEIHHSPANGNTDLEFIDRSATPALGTSRSPIGSSPAA